MAIVTLTGQLGAMGSIARRVADGLGYTLADRELLLEAAQALGWSEDEVAAFDERTGGQGGRLARFLRQWAEYASLNDADAIGLGTLAATTYGDAAVVAEMRPHDRRYIEILSALVSGLADRGDAVIVGRGGQALLAGRSDTVHVCVVCDVDERTRRIAKRDGMSPHTASVRVSDADRQRGAWHQKYFGIDPESPHLYHLALNSGRISDEVAASLVMQLVEKVTPLPMAISSAGVPPQISTRPPAGGARSAQDWGWIQLIDPDTGSVHARAHLFATEVMPGGEWSGELRSVHLSPGISSLRSAGYIVRFPGSGTNHEVELEVNPTEVQVRSADAEVPAIVRERAEG